MYSAVFWFCFLHQGVEYFFGTPITYFLGLVGARSSLSKMA